MRRRRSTLKQTSRCRESGDEVDSTRTSLYDAISNSASTLCGVERGLGSWSCAGLDRSSESGSSRTFAAHWSRLDRRRETVSCGIAVLAVRVSPSTLSEPFQRQHHDREADSLEARLAVLAGTAVTLAAPVSGGTPASGPRRYYSSSAHQLTDDGSPRYRSRERKAIIGVHCFAYLNAAMMVMLSVWEACRPLNSRAKCWR